MFYRTYLVLPDLEVGTAPLYYMGGGGALGYLFPSYRPRQQAYTRIHYYQERAAYFLASYDPYAD